MKFESQYTPNNNNEDILESYRSQKFIEKLISKLQELEPSKINLVKAIINRDTVKKMKSDLDKKYDVLTELSEELIESPEANSPEIREKRMNIAKEINFIMDTQEKLKDLFFEIDTYEDIIRSSSNEEIEEAKKISASINTEVDNFFNIRPELN